MHSSYIKKKGELGVILSRIKEGDIVFDVGACVGNWFKYVLANFQNVKIYAFEPFDVNFQKLLCVYGKEERAIIHPYAIKNDEQLFYTYANHTSFSTFYRRNDKVETRFNLDAVPVKVGITSLDEFCVTHGIQHINFLKIDVEGAEFDVLKSADNLLENKQIDNIQFEYGGCYLDAGITLKEVYTFLSEKGYLIHKIHRTETKLIPKWQDDLENFKMINFLAVKI